MASYLSFFCFCLKSVDESGDTPSMWNWTFFFFPFHFLEKGHETDNMLKTVLWNKISQSVSFHFGPKFFFFFPLTAAGSSKCIGYFCMLWAETWFISRYNNNTRVITKGLVCHSQHIWRPGFLNVWVKSSNIKLVVWVRRRQSAEVGVEQSVWDLAGCSVDKKKEH